MKKIIFIPRSYDVDNRISTWLDDPFTISMLGFSSREVQVAIDPDTITITLPEELQRDFINILLEASGVDFGYKTGVILTPEQFVAMHLSIKPNNTP